MKLVGECHWTLVYLYLLLHTKLVFVAVLWRTKNNFLSSVVVCIAVVCYSHFHKLIKKLQPWDVVVFVRNTRIYFICLNYFAKYCRCRWQYRLAYSCGCNKVYRSMLFTLICEIWKQNIAKISLEMPKPFSKPAMTIATCRKLGLRRKTNMWCILSGEFK